MPVPSAIRAPLMRPPRACVLQVYFSTLQQDTIDFLLELDLSQAKSREIVRRLWERALTTPTDFWSACTLGGSSVSYEQWPYPHVPTEGALNLTYSVKLAIKPYDRGVYFSQPMAANDYGALVQTLKGEGPTDFDRLSLLKQAALRNYFTSTQVMGLVDNVGLRKAKIECATLMHPRTTDHINFAHALRSLDKESDRSDILEMVSRAARRSRTRRARRRPPTAPTAHALTPPRAAGGADGGLEHEAPDEEGLPGAIRRGPGRQPPDEHRRKEGGRGARRRAGRRRAGRRCAGRARRRRAR